MRVVKWEEFRTLPSGTIFQEYKLHNLGELQILGDFWSNDFISAPLTPDPGFGGNLEDDHPLRNSGDLLIRTPAGYGRDGLFHLDQRVWLIWEYYDCTRLANWLLNPVSAAEIQNDDDEIFVVPKDIVDFLDEINKSRYKSK